MASISTSPALRLFISYSHKDRTWREKLAIFLKPLERDGLVSSWYDGRIEVGTDFDLEIAERLATSDIAVLLLSATFLASDYCFSKELQQALQRHALGEIKIVPVLLKTCEWNKSPIAHLQILPRNGIPISRWRDADEAFTAVVGELRALVQSQISRQDATPSEPHPAYGIGYFPPPKQRKAHAKKSRPSSTESVRPSRQRKLSKAAPTVGTHIFPSADERGVEARPRTHFSVVLEGKVSDLNHARALSIAADLQKLLRDSSLSIREVSSGSIVLTVESTARAFRQLQRVIATGRDLKLAGFSVKAAWEVEPNQDGARAIENRIAALQIWLPHLFEGRVDAETAKDLSQELVLLMLQSEDLYELLGSPARIAQIANSLLKQHLRLTERRLRAESKTKLTPAPADRSRAFELAQQLFNALPAMDRELLEQYWSSRFAGDLVSAGGDCQEIEKRLATELSDQLDID